jgi:membrane protein DedA with SNARE-associated domain
MSGCPSKEENHMLKIIGVLLNLGIIVYLGYQAASCLGPEQMESLDAVQHPLILSFVAVVALFIALKN